jgi:hypothetical protein
MKHFNYLKQALIPVLLVLVGALSANAQPLNGTYTVGTGGNYNDLNAACTALNNNGVNGPVVMNILPGTWSGSTWQGILNNITGASSTNTITFQAQGGSGTSTLSPTATSTTNNYVFRLNGTNWVRIQNLTLSNNGTSFGVDIDVLGAASNNIVQNCVLTGNTGLSTSTFKSRIYANGVTGSNNSFLNNSIPLGTSWGIYLYGNSSTRPVNWVYEGNTVNPYYGSVFGYFANDLKIRANNFSPTATISHQGIYLYECDNALEISGNTQVTTTSSVFYSLYMYYCNGTSFANKARILNNTFTMTGATGGVNPFYLWYCDNDSFVNNNFTASTTSTLFNYNYYAQYMTFKGNTFNMTAGSSTMYLMYAYSYGYGGYMIYDGNTFIGTSAGSASPYFYPIYYGDNGQFINNTCSLSTNTGSAICYPLFYSNNGICSNNTFYSNCNGSGTAYGAYLAHNSSATTNVVCANNKVFARSNTGAIYGLYSSGGNASIYNNSVTIMGTGNSTSIAFAASFCYGPTSVYNNTVYDGSTSTSTAHYTVYGYNMSSYGGVVTWRNNSFVKASANGRGLFYLYDNSTFNDFDYNNYYTPGTTLVSQVLGGTYATLTAWRAARTDNRNSLSYPPAFVSPTTGDLTPDVSAPGCWALNGRGVHMAGNNKDINGTNRHLLTFSGVPDIGAYEFTPNSSTIPPLCAVTPAVPAAGGTQTYTLGEDTVATITWDAAATVPATAPDVRQYTGTVPPSLSSINPTNMYFYTDISSGTSADYTTNIYYKDPWMGTIAAESALRLAKKDGSNPWIGYGSTVSGANTVRNFIYSPASPKLNNYGLYTGIDVPNNASADAIVEPSGTFCASTIVVKLRIKNTGNNNINPVNVNWQLDGGPVVTIPYTTTIPFNNGTPGINEAIITLGPVTFGVAPRTIKAWTSQPNNVTDPVPGDDTLNVTLRAALLGDYTVGGTTPDFPTPTAAIAALQTAGMCGPVTFKVRAGTYVGRLDIANIPGSSIVNRLTIRADDGVPASTVNINYAATGTADNYVIRLNNTSHISLKNLSINATAASYGNCIRLNGITNNDSIIGCNITNQNNSPTTFMTGIEGNNSRYDNLVVKDNTINASYGAYLFSNFANTPGLIIDNNIINSYYNGIYYIYNFLHAKVRNNTITATGGYLYPFSGISYWYRSSSSGTDITEFTNNKVYDFQYGTYYFTYHTGTPTNRVQMNNNVITYEGTGTAYYGFGYTYQPSYANFMNNTVVIKGANYPYCYSAQIYQVSGNTDSIYNNIFSCYNTGYAMYMLMYTGYNHRMDNNLLYTNGTNLIYDGWGTYTNLTTLRTSSGYATGNANAHSSSISFDPALGAKGVPNAASPNVWAINGRALQIPTTPTDITGAARYTVRQNGVSDIGAYEVEPSVIPPAATPAPNIPAPGVTQVFTFGETTVATVKWNTQLALTSPVSVRQYSGEVAPAGFPTVSQNKYPYFYTNITPTGLGSTYDFDLTVNYYDFWLGKIPNEANMKLAHKFSTTPWVSYNEANSSSNVTANTIFAAGVTSFGDFTGIDDGVNFSATVKAVGSTVICTGNNVTLNASPVSSGSTTYMYQWKRNGIDIAGATGSSLVVTMGGDYTVMITATSVVPNKTAESIPVTVTAVAPPMAVVTANGALTFCTGSNLVLNAGTVPGVTYQWQLNGANIPGATGNTYNVTGAGTYSVIVKNIGCATTSGNTLVNAGPIMVELGTDITGCEIKNTPYILDAGYPGAKYTWSTGDTTQTIEVYKGSGVYTVTVDAGPNCIGSDQIAVALDPLPTATGISYLRNGNMYYFSPSGDKNATTYLWLFGDGTTSNYKTVNKAIDGSMLVKLVIGNTCGNDTITMAHWATGVSNTVNEALEADVYPNPAKEKVTLAVKGAMLKDVTILNVLGEVVYRTELDGKQAEHSINISALAAGRYIIRANTTEGAINKPFNVQ